MQLQPPPTFQLPWQTPEYKEKMRQRRNVSLQRYRLHSLVLGPLAVIALGIGGATFYYTSADRASLYVGGPLLPGIFGVVCCFITYRLYQSGITEGNNTDPSGKLKCLVVLHYVFHLLLVIMALNLLAPIIIAMTSCGHRDDCENETEVLIVCILGLITCVTMGGWAIVALVFYSMYVRSYGFLGRNQRLLQLQTIAMANMSYQQGYGQQHPGPQYWSQQNQQANINTPSQFGTQSTAGVVYNSMQYSTQYNTVPNKL